MATAKISFNEAVCLFSILKNSFIPEMKLRYMINRVSKAIVRSMRKQSKHSSRAAGTSDKACGKKTKPNETSEREKYNDESRREKEDEMSVILQSVKVVRTPSRY